MSGGAALDEYMTLQDIVLEKLSGLLASRCGVATRNALKLVAARKDFLSILSFLFSGSHFARLILHCSYSQAALHKCSNC